MKHVVIFLSVIVGVTFGALAVNAGLNKSTVENCAELLPAGYQFNVEITGTIDTSSENRDFKVQFNLGDGTINENPPVKDSVKPFLNCAMPLIKAGVNPL